MAIGSGEEDTNLEKAPRVTKYNSDGTINKNYVQGKGARKSIQDMKDTEADSTSGMEAWRTTERMHIKKQNEKRDEARMERADAAMKVKNKRASAGNKKAEVHFAKYVDHVRVEKDKAKKKLKEKRKRSYYEDQK